VDRGEATSYRGNVEAQPPEVDALAEDGIAG
jgi:hypothetical protein